MNMMRRIAGGMHPEELVEFAVWVERQGGHIEKWLPLIQGVCYRLPEGRTVIRTLREGTWDENDTRVYALGYSIHEDQGSPSWNLEAVQAPALWSLTKGDGVYVAVVDSGVDMHHPGLPRVTSGYNAVDPEQPPQDENGHGTHVAGIVAGQWEGGSGVAPEATIVPVKVLDENGAGSLADVIDGLHWCLKQDIPIINLSLGAPQGTQAMHAAVTALSKAGLLVIAAAGNEGPRSNTVSYPAYWSETMAVAASTEAEKIAIFSSRGPQVDLTAPGQSIVSTWPGGGTKVLSGTSMAAPHVSGGAALLWVLAKQKSQLQQPRELTHVMLRSCLLLPSYSAEAQGRGLIQLGVAAQI